tara:strand:+ start:2501 stop:2806 length:306 start_codon:yes stop_codon:yes gene_type:complete
MVNKEDLKYPFIILFCLFLLVIFHVWFSSHVEEEHWKSPTPIPDSLDNIYNWPPNVNYLGTPIPDNQVMDPFRKKIIEDYRIFMEKRRNVYDEWKKQNWDK